MLLNHPDIYIFTYIYLLWVTILVFRVPKIPIQTTESKISVPVMQITHIHLQPGIHLNVKSSAWDIIKTIGKYLIYLSKTNLRQFISLHLHSAEYKVQGDIIYGLVVYDVRTEPNQFK